MVPVLFVIAYFTPQETVASFVAVNVAILNLFMLVFNLIPAFPLDGGRLLRSTLSAVLKDSVKATNIAGRIGQAFAVLFVLIGAFYFQIGLLVIGAFLFLAAGQEIEYAKHSFEATTSGTLDTIAGLRKRLDEFDRKRNQI